MDAENLCTLLAQRIPPEQFRVHGMEVVFFDPDKNNKPVTAPNKSPYDTPANRAIVEDVIKNYDKLAATHIDTTKIETEKASLIQAKMRELAVAELTKEGKLTSDGIISYSLNK